MKIKGSEFNPGKKLYAMYRELPPERGGASHREAYFSRLEWHCGNPALREGFHRVVGVQGRCRQPQIRLARAEIILQTIEPFQKEARLIKWRQEMAFKTYERARRYRDSHTVEFRKRLAIVPCLVFRTSNLGGDKGWCRWTVVMG